MVMSSAWPAREGLDRFEDDLLQMVERLFQLSDQSVAKPGTPVHLLVRIDRFRDPVAEQDDRVSWIELHACKREFSSGDQARDMWHPLLIGGSAAGPVTCRAHALAGDAAKASAEYQDFFAPWKGAGRDIPILKQAKAEYSKLQ
jgi:hypothetical protein